MASISTMIAVFTVANFVFALALTFELLAWDNSFSSYIYIYNIK